MKFSLLVSFAALAAFSGGDANLAAQQRPGVSVSSACAAGDPCVQLSPHAEQVAGILGIKPLVEQALAMRASRPAGVAMTVEELSRRQEISEAILAASFDADGVLAEIAEEQGRIAEVGAFLQARRDRGVNLATLASLVTGSGVGIAVNALQFSSSTADIGNGIGVGSGVASTALSLVGIRLQRGPKRQIGSAPNMLACLWAAHLYSPATIPKMCWPTSTAFQRAKRRSAAPDWNNCCTSGSRWDGSIHWTRPRVKRRSIS